MRFSFTLFLSVLSLGVLTPANAIVHIPSINAAGICQAALPVYEGLIRKRPTAVSNEGTSSAFVTCSLYGDITAHNYSDTIAFFSNRTAGSKIVTCTMVNGDKINGSAPLVIITKSVDIGEQNSAFLAFRASDNGGVNFSPPFLNYSCLLPAGTEINVIESTFVDDAAQMPPL